MNIYTESVQNKHYVCAIKPCLLKYSQEYRVLATLRYLFPGKYETMFSNDSPDLQDYENSVGVEVVSAVGKNDMKAARAFSKLCRSSNNREIEEQKTKIASSGYSLGMTAKKKQTISITGTSNDEKFFFQESMKKKKIKLQQYKSKFEVLGLAVVLPEIPTSEAENRFIDWICDVFQEDDNLFDFVYIFSHRFCLFYDVRTGCSQKWEIAKEENRLLCTIARMTAESELTLENQEWK